MNAEATEPPAQPGAQPPKRRPQNVAWYVTPPRLLLVPPLLVGLFILSYAV